MHDDDAAESDAHEDEPKKTPQKSAKKVRAEKIVYVQLYFKL